MYLDSPFTHCDRVGEFVLLDQTYEECRRDARCLACPLQSCFSGHAFSKPAPARAGETQSPAALPRVA